jgi:hypothetical protein
VLNRAEVSSFGQLWWKKQYAITLPRISKKESSRVKGSFWDLLLFGAVHESDGWI